jgi:hypothetical protein
MMVNGQDPVHAAIPPGRTAGRTAAGLPSPRLAFTGRFRAGKAGSGPLPQRLAELVASPDDADALVELDNRVDGVLDADY